MTTSWGDTDGKKKREREKAQGPDEYICIKTIPQLDSHLKINEHEDSYKEYWPWAQRLQRNSIQDQLDTADRATKEIPTDEDKEKTLS